LNSAKELLDFKNNKVSWKIKIVSFRFCFTNLSFDF
jgi:hypothetical protein